MTRIVGLGLAVVVLGASSTDGQRASTGWCPEGEQCADDTPEGLSFEGAQVSWFIGNGLIPTAVGGTQTVRITDKATDELFDLPFVVNATNTEAHRASVTGMAQATIEAEREGSGYLRIARVQDNYLFDRVTIESKPIARGEVRLTMAARWPNLDEARFAVWGGGETELTVALLDASDGWLADESLRISTPFAPTPIAWDAIAVTAPVNQVVLPVAFEAGGGTFIGSADVPVVTSLTSVSAWSNGGASTLNQRAEVCFVARSNDIDVSGVPWVFDLTGGVMPASADAQLHPNCLVVDFVGVGVASITASADGQRATVEYQVQPPSARVVAPPAVWPWAGDRSEPGERALRSE